MPMFKADMTDAEIKKVREMKLELDAKNNVDYLIHVTACCKELRRTKGRDIL